MDDARYTRKFIIFSNFSLCAHITSLNLFNYQLELTSYYTEKVPFFWEMLGSVFG